MIAAIISGFGLWVVLIGLFVVMAIVYRRMGRNDAMKGPLKKQKKGEPNTFYSGIAPQSQQYLVSSMSVQSFPSSSSEVHLETPGVYHNRGFDSSSSGQSSRVGLSGVGAGIYENEDGFRPIQINADVSRPSAKGGVISKV